jgi:transcriptional regulator with XRE-family HTH domain
MRWSQNFCLSRENCYKMSGLQSKLKNILHDQHLGVAELERKAGLKVSAVRNILSGQSKNPSAETMLSISRVLGCSIEELLDSSKDEVTQHVSQDETLRKGPIVKDFKFLQKTTETVIRMIEDNFQDKGLTFKDMADLFSEVYQYSLKNSYPEIDLKFADWVITQRIEDKGY